MRHDIEHLIEIIELVCRIKVTIEDAGTIGYRLHFTTTNETIEGVSEPAVDLDDAAATLEGFLAEWHADAELPSTIRHGRNRALP